MSSVNTNEELKRMNEELRERVQQLKSEIEEERNEIKRMKHEKILDIKAVRDEEQENRRAEIEELKTTMQKKYQDDMKIQVEVIQKKFENELEAKKAAHAAELKEQLQKLEGEKREAVMKAKQDTERGLRADLEEAHKQEKRNLISESFAAQSKVTELEERCQNLMSESRSLKKSIQSQDEEHQKSLNNLMKRSKQENQKQFEEIKEKDRQLHEKEKEAAGLRRKCAQFEAAKDELQFNLEMQKKANVPAPLIRQTTPTFGTSTTSCDQNDSEEESPQPMSPKVKELLIKNSELGYLASQRQQVIDKLKKEKAEQEGKLIALEREVEPLRTRHSENMRKIQDYTNLLSSRKKQLEKANLENSELRSEKDKIERQLKEERDKHRTRDHKLSTQLTELPRIKAALQNKEKEVEALKAETERFRELQRNAETERKRERARESSRSTPGTPISNQKLSDIALANQRVQDYKKKQESELKLKETDTKLQEAIQTKNKLSQRVEDLRASLKRRDQQIKQLSEEVYKLKSANQQLEESRERSQKELESEWQSSHTELERAHAQINKLQQKNTSLRVELDRLTPSPQVSPPSHLSKPISPLIFSSPTHTRSPTPSPPPPHPPSSSPPHLPSSSPPHLPLQLLSVMNSDDDFGSQWSLISNESIMKEQIEQLEYDKNEISIKYDELKKEYGNIKGHYNAVREKYNSLLEKSRNLQEKCKLINKEKLQMEKEMSLLQDKCQSEFDVERERNLRKKLNETLHRVEELEKQLEETQEDTVRGAEEKLQELKEEREQNENLNERVSQLIQQTNEQQEENNQINSLLTTCKVQLNEHKQQVSELKKDLAEKDGQLEGEKAIITSLQQQLHQLIQKDRVSPLTTVSSHSVPSPLSPQPNIQECLQSAKDVTSQIQQIIKTGTQTSPAALSSDHLIKQLQDLLSEAKQLVEHQSSLTKEIAQGQLSPVQASPLKQEYEETDSAHYVPNKNEKFQQWLTQFESEKVSLKSRISDLEKRLQDGSHRVKELQSLVGDLEDRLSAEQSIHASLLAEREELLMGSHQAMPLRYKHELIQALNKTHKAVDKENIQRIRKEVDKLDQKIKELLELLYNETFTSADKMTSSPFYKHSMEDELTSLSPSPIKSVQLSSSPLTPFEESLTKGGSYATPIAVLPTQSPPSIVSPSWSYTQPQISTLVSLPIKTSPTKSPPHTYAPPTKSTPDTYAPPTKSPPDTYASPTKSPPDTYAPPTKSPLHTYAPPTKSPPDTYAPPTKSPLHTYVPPTKSPLHTYVPPTKSPPDTYVPPTKSPLHTYVPPTKSPPHTKPLTMSAVNLLMNDAAGYISSDYEPKLFVVLFNYNPESLCSTGHPERELNVRTGDVILVVSDMDSFGYYKAVFDGRCGLVPSAFIQEMKIDDKGAQQRLLNQSLSHSNCSSVIGSEIDMSRHRSLSPTSSQFAAHTTSPVRMTSPPASKDSMTSSSAVTSPMHTSPIKKNEEPSAHGKETKYVRALYSYVPAKDSPNPEPEMELGFVKGDIIMVNGKIREDGFYVGKLKGKHGFVPSNFVTEIDDPPHYVLQV